MPDMSMTVNVHNAKIEKVFEINDTWPADQFVITIGNDAGGYGNTIDVFTTDAEWDAIVATVAERRIVLKAERAQRDAEKIGERLEYLRRQIHSESISYGEIAELQGLADHIASGDVELLEWAGVPENGDEK